MSIRELLDDGTTPATWKKVAVNRIRFGASSSGLSNSNVVTVTAAMAAGINGLPAGTVWRYTRVGNQVTVSMRDGSLPNPYSHVLVVGGPTADTPYANITTVGALIQADRTAIGADLRFPILVSATNDPNVVPGSIELLAGGFNIRRLDLAPGVEVALANNAQIYNFSFSYTLP